MIRLEQPDGRAQKDSKSCICSSNAPGVGYLRLGLYDTPRPADTGRSFHRTQYFFSIYTLPAVREWRTENEAVPQETGCAGVLANIAGGGRVRDPSPGESGPDQPGAKILLKV